MNQKLLRLLIVTVMTFTPSCQGAKAAVEPVERHSHADIYRDLSSLKEATESNTERLNRVLDKVQALQETLEGRK